MMRLRSTHHFGSASGGEEEIVSGGAVLESECDCACVL
jgi:hypothetical protein